MLFFLLINVKIPTIVGILTFMRGKFSCSAKLSLDFFITLGPDLLWHLSIFLPFFFGWGWGGGGGGGGQ